MAEEINNLTESTDNSANLAQVTTRQATSLNWCCLLIAQVVSQAASSKETATIHKAHPSTRLVQTIKKHLRTVQTNSD